jgi:signal peptidase I
MLEYKEYHFDIGDICVFEKTNEDTELVKGEVYGYKYKDIIITHRLVEIHEGNLYEFRGDNNSISDPYYVKGENIIYHYTGQKVPGIGAFILYAQSIFGIWSLAGIIGVAVSSEIVYYKINKINKERDKIIYIPEEKQVEEEIKEPTAEAPSKTHKEEEGASNEK